MRGQRRAQNTNVHYNESMLLLACPLPAHSAGGSIRRAVDRAGMPSASAAVCGRVRS